MSAAESARRRRREECWRCGRESWMVCAYCGRGFCRSRACGVPEAEYCRECLDYGEPGPY